ncbi:MAG: alpha/beta fold hydrolase [Candidatus Manganitrophus sp.]|nr:alpha/beta fold hydrolase [Candidatus Manganitrophus sp.]WDT72642.1 MAG: alpha/beta fold hydrolase [Candidatus Manganitrophus sp.]WDT79898.1 MAG: alpha/beta fold hydrolase [Candidatus Manganitrophus sp.]
MQIDDFNPAWWCPGPHLQTVWRRLYGEIPTVTLRRERWETPDDDFLDLDFFDPEPTAREPVPTVLCLHGLEGSSRAKYILGMLREANRLGWRGTALNFRSCSGEINRQRRFYHSGETSDIDWVVRRLIERFPGSPFFLIGFSLGGNVLLKWLGEQGEKAPDPVRGAVAISVPFDLAEAARNIDRGFSRIYGKVFLRTLKEKALIKERQYPGLVDPARLRRIASFAAFDDQVTAPVHGFRDGVDYWTSTSSKSFSMRSAGRSSSSTRRTIPSCRGSAFPSKSSSNRNGSRPTFLSPAAIPVSSEVPRPGRSVIGLKRARLLFSRRCGIARNIGDQSRMRERSGVVRTGGLTS